MADWPELAELKQVLNVTDTPESETPWDGDDDGTRLTRLLEAAIAFTKAKIGSWDEYEDEPTAMQAQAALRAAMLLAPPMNRAPEAIETDPQFNALLLGSRRRFPIS